MGETTDDAATRPAAGPLAIRYRDIEELEPYDRNARTHSPTQIEMVKASLLEFGWTTPIALADDGILAGHARRLAAKALRDEGKAIPGNPDPNQVPTVDLSHLNPVQRKAYVLADNQIAAKAGWDPDMLVMELDEIMSAGFDLFKAGFEPGDLADLLNGMAPNGGLTDPDDAPEPPVHPVTRPGDLWILGPHRILCGDSTVETDVRRLLGDVRPNLMVTDPPYGVNYDPGWRKDVGLAKKVASGKVLNDDRADWREAWALFPGNVAYVWHAGIFASTVEDSLKACGFRVRAQIVWVKTRFVLGRGHYHPQHEPAYYAVKDGADDGWAGQAPQRYEDQHEDVAYAVREGGTGEWHGGRKQSTVWTIEHLKSETGHGTQKPVEAMRRPILNNSTPGQAVYEPFSGSGTTIMAGELTGRSVLAIELSPAYVDVAVRRWQDFTGKVATLEGDGRSFAEVAEARPIGEEVPDAGSDVPADRGAQDEGPATGGGGSAAGPDRAGSGDLGADAPESLRGRDPGRGDGGKRRRGRKAVQAGDGG